MTHAVVLARIDGRALVDGRLAAGAGEAAIARALDPAVAELDTRAVLARRRHERARRHAALAVDAREARGAHALVARHAVHTRAVVLAGRGGAVVQVGLALVAREAQAARAHARRARVEDLDGVGRHAVVVERAHLRRLVALRALPAALAQTLVVGAATR